MSDESNAKIIELKNRYNKNYISQLNSFHHVNPSSVPLKMAGALFLFTLTLTLFFHDLIHFNWIYSAIFILIYNVYNWLALVSKEGLQGHHTAVVIRGLKIGFLLFIISEVMFFFSFFWSFFHFSLAPSIWGGAVWPPEGIPYTNPYGIPFLNTVLLLSSGITITYAHRGARQGSKKHVIRGLTLSILYGLIFLLLQYHEYNSLVFNIADSVYGSIFYVLTGFHGLHVILGLVFLTKCLLSAHKGIYRSKNHAGLEAAIYYWHFVDVVWIFLYICVYYWGSAEEYDIRRTWGYADWVWDLRGLDPKKF